MLKVKGFGFRIWGSGFVYCLGVFIGDSGFVDWAWQSARIAYLSWKIEIRRDWYRSQNGRDCGAKVKMCTPVHGLYV